VRSRSSDRQLPGHFADKANPAMLPLVDRSRAKADWLWDSAILIKIWNDSY